MSMYDEGFALDGLDGYEFKRSPAVVIRNSVSTRISGPNDDIEVTLDDGGEFNIAQCGESLVMNRDEAEALFMVLGNMLSLDAE